MAKYTNEEMCLLWLDSFESLEYAHKIKVFELIKGKDSIKSVITSAKDYLVENIGEERFKTIEASASGEYLKFVLSEIDRWGVTPITFFSENYPEKLKETSIPPLVLYTIGDLKLLNSKCFGMVGSRKSSALALKTAEEFSTAMSNAGFTLVTGIAEGVDKAVIEGTLNANGKVISVIAGGFNNLYPKSHQDLFEKIKKTGLVISEHPVSVVPKPYMFPVRNRIIAGLSNGVLIVSAGSKSGAIYTAEYAEEYSRDVFAVPYSIGVSCGEGTNDLIKRGAMLTDKASDILSFYGIEQKVDRQDLTADEKQIATLLKDGEMHVEAICKKLGKKIFEITPLISSLEIKGYITQSGINVYSLCQTVSEE